MVASGGSVAEIDLMKLAKLEGVEPGTLAVPVRPVLEHRPDDLTDPTTWRPAHLVAGPFTLAEASRRRFVLSEAYRTRFLAGDVKAVRELVDRDPEFMREPWVREAVIRLMEQGRFEARDRGRPKKRSSEVLGIGLALVAFVDQQIRETGRSRDAILRELARAGFASLGYEGIRALYRRTKNDDRLQPLVF